ncbi:PREDICTED: oligopeptide transporter 4-like [Erythranthe guttata]|uniref:oligopeptide transporter 4-like n=1 Tax=Erythranthe guttata TaxID=4155 RepID=UPI00064D81C7|nr:PREDICTED: oligopeptide transporter 4-like [Erythranthe guttata]|eukprot:XP_012832688.1 PREDICTED: oligopeptide transporter 4-like [Erythranthe guttata]
MAEDQGNPEHLAFEYDREPGRDHEQPRPNLPPERTMREYRTPAVNENYSGIRKPTIAANNFELKTGLINMVMANQFSGAATADPNLHLANFLEICDTIKVNGVSDDAIRLKLFSFSVRDKAKSWLLSLNPGSLTCWEELSQAFLARFFPPSKTAQLRRDVGNFRQMIQEPMHESWERFKDLLRQCPQHGFNPWDQMELFYNGLDQPARSLVDAASDNNLRRALHEKESSKNSRARFFLIAMGCSFCWYIFPGYLFPTLSNISLLCLAYPNSVTAQQIGSGMRGLGIASFTFDWSVVASFLGSPLVTPFFAILNVFLGYFVTLYIMIPICYWGLNLYAAKTFPIFSSHMFDHKGQVYNVSAIVNDKFEIDLPTYDKLGRINLSMFFAVTYGLNFAAIVATLTHVAFFNGNEIYERFKDSHKGKQDIHTRLMRKYEDIPNWWFYGILVITFGVSLLLCTVMIDQVQLPCPPRSMFIVQLVGTLIAGLVNIAVAWYLLTNIENICQDELLPPNSQWTCPNDRVFYDASVIWGLVGPKRFFGTLGNYNALNWFFLGGAVGPFFVWILHKALPSQKWIKSVNLPILLGATAAMPPATTLNFNSWMLVGTIFNLFVFRYRKAWWQRYNYVLSAALDAGLAFMGVALYFTLGIEEVTLTWWGSKGEHCDLATCPTARGVIVDGCPVH